MSGIQIGRSEQQSNMKFTRSLTAEERNFLLLVSDGNWNDNHIGNFNINYLFESLSYLKKATDLLSQYAANNRANFHSNLLNLSNDTRKLNKYYHQSGLQKANIASISEQTESIQEIVNNVSKISREEDNGILDKLTKLPVAGGIIKKVFKGVGTSMDVVQSEEVFKNAQKSINEKVKQMEELRNSVSLENARLSDAINQDVLSYQFLQQYAFPYFENIHNVCFEQIVNLTRESVEDNPDCKKFLDIYEKIKNRITEVQTNAVEVLEDIKKEDLTISKFVDIYTHLVEQFNSGFNSKIRELRQEAITYSITENINAISAVEETVHNVVDVSREQSQHNLDMTIATKKAQAEREAQKHLVDQQFSDLMAQKVAEIQAYSQADDQRRLEAAEEKVRKMVQQLSITDGNGNGSDPIAIDLGNKG